MKLKKTSIGQSQANLHIEETTMPRIEGSSVMIEEAMLP